MRVQLQYEFKAYAGDENGVVAAEAEVSIVGYTTDSTAFSAAGRLAKRIKGPVDIARAGDEPWEARYLTTASPCEFTGAGFRLERLDG